MNGYFALTPNRCGIREHPDSDIDVRWNKCLIEDALTNAYVQLLHDAKSLSVEGRIKEYSFYALWPTYDTLHSSIWKELVKKFLYKIGGKFTATFL